jgi:hypothetical protein
MPDLDYRDFPAHSVSVADLLEFDALVARLSDAERTAVYRKISWEVSDRANGIANRIEAEDRSSLYAQLSRTETRLKGMERDKEAAESIAKTFRDELVAIEAKLSALQNTHSDIVGRHGRELQQAEIVGYQRGKEEARDAA